MTWLQFGGVVLVVWLWIVCGVCLLRIGVDWLDHRRDGKLQQAHRLVKLWRNGSFKRVH